MTIEIRPYTRDRIRDVIRFENALREEEDFWGWEIDEAYIARVTACFDNPAFDDAISFLAYAGETVVGRIDASLLRSRFDGSTRAYLDWICVVKSCRHRGVAQTLTKALLSELKRREIDTLVALTAANEEAQRFYRAIPHSEMHDTGIWIRIP